MNPILKFFGVLSGLIKKAFGLAQKAGLTDKTVQDALAFVKEAATKFIDKAERREWVIKKLAEKGVPEGVARIAVELAVKLWKSEVMDTAEPEFLGV